MSACSSLAEEHGDAAVKVEHLADALDHHLDAAPRLCGLLQSEHQAIDDRLALGLRLDGREQARVGDGFGRLRREDFQQLHVALAKAAGTIRHVDKADQLALDAAAARSAPSESGSARSNSWLKRASAAGSFEKKGSPVR